MNARMRAIGSFRLGTAQHANARQMRNCLQWLLRQGSLESLSVHGNTSWQPPELISLALLWVWSAAARLTDAFEEACAQSHELFGSAAVTTYQGLAGALQTWTVVLVPLLQRRIHELLEDIGAKNFRVGRWCAIAIDGSRLSTPRTISNERAFCAPTYGRGKTAKYRRKKTKGMRRLKNARAPAQPQGPQIWTTLMWHIGLGLPWCWKLGPSNSSERQHVSELLTTGHFVKNTLFVGDAGFVGYDLWRSIRAQGHHFLVRVGGNVHLLRDLEVRRSRQSDSVWCWPQTAAQQHLPPLELRLISVPLGRTTAWLLTSVLPEKLLTRGEMLRLYKLRWGVELQFRGLKQTFARRRLRSRTSERAVVELEWALLGLTVVQLFALQQQLADRADPRRLSLSRALRAIRRSLGQLRVRTAQQFDLKTLLRDAVLDNYQRHRSKTARFRPYKPDIPACGRPCIARASADDRRRFACLRENGKMPA